MQFALLPAYRDSDALAHDFSLPDRRVELMHYMDTSLPPGLYIANYDNHKTFNRSWGGYDGINDFPWYPDHAELPDKPIEEWRRLGVEYAIMPFSPLLEQIPYIYYPDQTVMLKTYPVSDAFRGP